MRSAQRKDVNMIVISFQERTYKSNVRVDMTLLNFNVRVKTTRPTTLINNLEEDPFNESISENGLH